MIPYAVLDQISIGPLNLNVWGILVSLGFIVGLWAAYKELKKKGERAEKILDLSFWIILISLVGSRIFFVLNEFEFFIQNPLDIFKIWEGGAMIYGGLAGGALAGIIFIRKNKFNLWSWTDSILFALPLGIFIGRIGCFLIHDHLGKITSLPWGIKYIDGTIRHETSIYTSLGALILFLIFLLFKRSRYSSSQGFHTIFFMLWYGLERFFLDFLRATDLPVNDPRWFGLTPSQYLSIILVSWGIYLLMKKKKNFQAA